MNKEFLIRMQPERESKFNPVIEFVCVGLGFVMLYLLSFILFAIVPPGQ